MKDSTLTLLVSAAAAALLVPGWLKLMRERQAIAANNAAAVEAFSSEPMFSSPGAGATNAGTGWTEADMQQIIADLDAIYSE